MPKDAVIDMKKHFKKKTEHNKAPEKPILLDSDGDPIVFDSQEDKAGFIADFYANLCKQDYRNDL